MAEASHMHASLGECERAEQYSSDRSKEPLGVAEFSVECEVRLGRNAGNWGAPGTKRREHLRVDAMTGWSVNSAVRQDIQA